MFSTISTCPESPPSSYRIRRLSCRARRLSDRQGTSCWWCKCKRAITAGSVKEGRLDTASAGLFEGMSRGVSLLFLLPQASLTCSPHQTSASSSRHTLSFLLSQILLPSFSPSSSHLSCTPLHSLASSSSSSARLGFNSSASIASWVLLAPLPLDHRLGCSVAGRARGSSGTETRGLVKGRRKAKEGERDCPQVGQIAFQL